MITLHRTPILDEAKSAARGWDCFDLGLLRASLFGIRIPVRVAQWINRVVLR